MKQHLSVLGKRVTDRITGFHGVVTTVSFDLYGCIQCVVNPGLDDAGKLIDSAWFDISRLRVDCDTPVMAQPDYDWSSEAISSGLKGSAEKPAFLSIPAKG